MLRLEPPQGFPVYQGFMLMTVAGGADSDSFVLRDPFSSVGAGLPLGKDRVGDLYRLGGGEDAGQGGPYVVDGVFGEPSPLIFMALAMAASAISRVCM